MTNRFVKVIIASSIIALCFTGCGTSSKKDAEGPSVSTVSGDTELSGNIENSENQNKELVQYSVLGCSFSLPGDWAYYEDEDAALVFELNSDAEFSIGLNYCHVDIPNWDDQYNLYLKYYEKRGDEIINSGLYEKNGLQGYYAETKWEYEEYNEVYKCIEYVFNANNKGTVHINYIVLDEDEYESLDDFYTMIDTLDVSGASRLIEERFNEEKKEKSDEEMQEIIKKDKEKIEKASKSHEDFIW